MSKAYEERQVNGHCKKRSNSCSSKVSTKPKNGIRTVDKTPGKKKVVERRKIVYFDEMSEDSSSASQSSDAEADSDDSTNSEGSDEESDCSTSSFEIIEPTKKRSRSSSKENEQKRTPRKDSSQGSQEEEGEGEEYSVEEILDMKLDNNGKPWFFIKWWNYGSDDNTWEPIENLSKCQEMVDEFLERRKRMKAQEARMAKGISGKRKRMKTTGLSKTDHLVDEQSMMKAIGVKPSDELVEKKNMMKKIAIEIKSGDELVEKKNMMKTIGAKSGEEFGEKKNMTKTIGAKSGEEFVEKKNMMKTIGAKSGEEFVEKQSTMRAPGLKVMNLKDYSTKENLCKKDAHEPANGLSSSFLQKCGYTSAKLQPTVKLNKIEPTPPPSTTKCNGNVEDSTSAQQSQQTLEIATIPQEPSIPYKVNPDIVELSIPNDFTRIFYHGSLYYFKIINGDKSDFLLIDYTKPLTEEDADDYYKCVVTEDLTGKEVKLVYGATKSVDGDTFCLVQFEGYSYIEVIPPENLFQKYPAFRRFFEVHCPHLFATDS
ncbi:unnamed protein product [Orchesella dallaii]|uniref:Chromo domain-containing protein n=1 Tax=Orchesella dallaii TaxID=48710 RepID=A0ABP1PKX6_9HEXA